jgi:hypothetical protein
MLSKLSDQFYSRASGRLILALLAGFVLFQVITLPLLSLFYPASNEMVSLDAPAFSPPLGGRGQGWGVTVIIF